jgi:hypothetical protein
MNDIREYDIIFLYGGHKPERLEHMCNMLSKLKLKYDYHEGVSHLGDISAATSFINLLEKRLSVPFKPFIFLEDDCSPTEWFRYHINIPTDADAVYLGISEYGMFNNRAVKYVIREDVNDEISRVFNMLSTHAVLFHTETWTKNVLECLKKTITNQIFPYKPRDFDILYAISMSNFKVYALRRPLFYQDEKMGGQQEPTLIEF